MRTVLPAKNELVSCALARAASVVVAARAKTAMRIRRKPTPPPFPPRLAGEGREGACRPLNKAIDIGSGRSRLREGVRAVMRNGAESYCVGDGTVTTCAQKS